jgi:hypothetical protein
MGWEWIVKGFVFGAKVARAVRANRIVAKIRDRAAIGLVTPLHSNIIHGMRRLSIQMTDWNYGQDAAAATATQIATDCRHLMGNLLELKANELHCCIKLIAPKLNSNAEDRVATWVRSHPLDDRPVEQGEANAHQVSTNTVWSALYGRSDGKTHWRPFSCFACNDLVKRGELFVCDRENWQRYYRSTMVFPLRYAKNAQATEFENIGFLAFDSPKRDAFLGIPDIFAHREDFATYQDKIEDSTAFHLGAICADTLSTFLRRTYEEREPGASHERAENPEIKSVECADSPDSD